MCDAAGAVEEQLACIAVGGMVVGICCSGWGTAGIYCSGWGWEQLACASGWRAGNMETVLINTFQQTW